MNDRRLMMNKEYDSIDLVYLTTALLLNQWFNVARKKFKIL